MKIRVIQVIVAVLALSFTGCETVKDVWENPLGRAVIRTSLYLASSSAAEHNPELRPYLVGIGNVMSTITEPVLPGAFDDMLNEYIDRNIRDPEMQRLIRDEVVVAASEAYSSIVGKWAGQLTDAQIIDVVRAMGERIEAGATGLTTASERVYTVQTEKLEVVIR